MRVVVALACAAYGCAAEEAAGREPSDAGRVADASRYDGLSCEQLYPEVWKLPRECDEANGCTIVGNSCTPGRLFIAVNNSNLQRATELHDVMRKSGCNLGWDGYIPRAECRGGQCTTVDTARACQTPWYQDAGDPQRIDGGVVAEGGASDGHGGADGAAADGAISDGALVHGDATMRDF